MSRRVVRPMGDRALVVDLPDGEQPHELAAALDELSLPGVEDCIPAARTVLVRFASARDAEAIADVLATVAPRPTEPTGRVVVEVPTTYDGADLGEIARLTGLAPDEVVARHTAALHTVAFVGFAPGFAYLNGGDPALLVPRRSSPRSSVPAGSVALADGYTGVYPRSSPGGWQLLGTTALTLFDPDRDPPARLTPGATVRFVAVDR